MKVDIIIGDRQSLESLLEEIEEALKKILDTKDEYYYLNEKVVIEIKVFPYKELKNDTD